MAEALRSLGQILLFEIPPGPPFLLAWGGAIFAATVFRVLTRNRAWMRTWLRIAGRLERIVITLLLVGMIGLSLVQIVLRNFFDTGFVWLDPLLRHAVLWIGFMGAALATAHDRHINIDVLSRTLRGTPARVAHAVLRVLAATVALFLANAAYLLLRNEYEFETTSFLQIPTWVLMLIIPVGLVIIAYRFLLSAWRGRLRDPGPETATATGAGDPSDGTQSPPESTSGIEPPPAEEDRP